MVNFVYGSRGVITPGFTPSSVKSNLLYWTSRLAVTPSAGS